MQRISLHQRYGPQRRAPVESTALHLVAEAPRAAKAFSDLRTWILGADSATLTLHEIETETHERIREVARLLLQEHVDERGSGDVGTAIELGAEADSLPVTLSHRRVRERQYLSLFGSITITRLSYGQRGRSSVVPLDEELSLPSRLYSYPVQQRLTTGVARGPFAEAVTALKETTSVGVGEANVDEVVIEVARDFDAFYAQRSGVELEAEASILISTLDGKGVPMRPEPGQVVAEREPGTTGPRPNSKREAKVAAVYAIAPYVRTPADILEEIGPKKGPKRVGPPRPRPQHKRVWASVEKSKDEVFAEVAEEMRRRDPKRKHIWACVTDGDPALQKRALSVLGADGEVILILDIFHVTEYLWDGARAFYGSGSEQTQEWVEYYLEKILYGEASEAARGMRQSATKQGLRGKRREAVDAAARYMVRNAEHMKYDEYLAAGLPIGSGVAEGTCRHLVKDRMERTGMRWRPRCAEAVLKMRAIEVCGDTEEYWEFHIKLEQERLHAASSWRPAA